MPLAKLGFALGLQPRMRRVQFPHGTPILNDWCSGNTSGRHPEDYWFNSNIIHQILCHCVPNWQGNGLVIRCRKTLWIQIPPVAPIYAPVAERLMHRTRNTDYVVSIPPGAPMLCDGSLMARHHFAKVVLCRFKSGPSLHLMLA